VVFYGIGRASVADPLGSPAIPRVDGSINLNHQPGKNTKIFGPKNHWVYEPYGLILAHKMDDVWEKMG